MFFHHNTSKEKIIEDRPFSSFLKIKSIESLATKKAVSGETYCVVSAEGKKYKLRACEKISKAKRIERNVILFPKAFPRFYGRDKNYLLFDWVVGEEITKKISEEDCYLIGKLVGEAHSLNAKNDGKTISDFFYSRFRILKEIHYFDDETNKRIEDAFVKLNKKIKADVVLDFHDLQPTNFIKDKNGRIYFVDEEGFDYRVKGLGFAKPFITGKWMAKKEQKEAFFRGYNEHCSSNYFNEDYFKMIGFLQYLRTMITKQKLRVNGKKVRENFLKYLDNLE